MTISGEAAIDVVTGLVGVSGHDILDDSRQNVAVVWGSCGTLIRGEGVAGVYRRRWMEKDGGAWVRGREWG